MRIISLDFNLLSAMIRERQKVIILIRIEIYFHDFKTPIEVRRNTINFIILPSNR